VAHPVAEERVKKKQSKKKRTSKQTHLNGSAGFLIHFPSSDIVMLNLGLLIADKGYWAKLVPA
jgi:hypothetical protein